MRGFACIGLDNPKYQYNVGSALRAATAFDVKMVAISGKRYQKSATDTTHGYKQFPFLHVADLRSVVPYDCIPVAVEIVDKAQSLVKYQHPERAFYIFGSEDATLGDRITSWCKHIVYIPTQCCLNLAACVNVILYDRMCKQEQHKE